MHLTLNKPTSSKGWAMQDKTDAAGYSVSGLAALLGLSTTNMLMVGISAIGMAATVYLSYWFKRAKLKEEQRRTDAAVEAEHARTQHYHSRREDDAQPDQRRET